MTGTRERIVTATNELFRRRGYNGTSLKDVTVASGATTGSLYHFFPGGKAELAAAVVRETGATYRELFEAIAAEAAGPVEAIGDFFDGAAAVLEETDYIDVCPIGTVAREVASVDADLRAAADEAFTSWIDSAARHLERVGVGPDRARELATALVAGLEGGFVLARSRRDAELLRTVGRQMQQLVASELAATRTAARRT